MRDLEMCGHLPISEFMSSVQNQSPFSVCGVTRLSERKGGKEEGNRAYLSLHSSRGCAGPAPLTLTPQTWLAQVTSAHVPSFRILGTS